MENKFVPIPEQQAILQTKNKSLIVSASAGSGKTTVMINKIVNHILDGDCHVSELLVLTYTKSASLEMKKKLMSKIKEKMLQNPQLEQELNMVQTSDISTFDSFCQKLVKKYFYILNIDPSFSVLDGQEQVFLQNKALEKCLETLKKTAPETYENLLNNFSAKRDNRTIKALVLEIYNYLTSIYDENEFINTSYNLYNPELKIAEQVILNYYISLITPIKNKLNNLLQKSNSLGFDKYSCVINATLSSIDSALLQKDFCSFLDYINEISLPVLRTDKNDEINLGAEISAQKKLLSKYFTDIKQQYTSSENIKNSYEKCQILIKNLIKTMFLFKNEYNLLKQNINSYDFNDIERFAISLLTAGDICNEIKGQYKYIFVDEFQDANKVQEKILFLLANNNLFFVGDTKQSIYAFRQSDPEIFLKLERDFYNQPNSDSKTLNCNFRTNKNILNFVNKIFSVIMTTNTCDIDYKNTAQFNPMAEYQDVENETCVSLNVLLPQESEQEKLVAKSVYSVKQNQNNTCEEDKFLAESMYVANKIVELVGQNIYDKETNTTRALNYSDINILVLKRGKFLDSLIQHFTDIGIPFVVNVNQNLEECYDNQVLFNLIKLALNFNDDYALYCVMSSALFGFNDGELAEIKLFNSDTKNYYQCVQNYNSANSLGEKILHFKQELNTFAYNMTYKGIYYALDTIVKSTNYFLNISQEKDYSSRKQNICDYIDSFINSKYNFSACDYCLYRETALRKDKVTTNKTFKNAVEITTMHASKGLEYPVVILPFLNSDFTKEPSLSDVKINKDIGIGIKNYDDTNRTISNGIFYNACKIKNKKIETSEKIRLLYVATTRAKNKLVLIGTLNKPVVAFENDVQIMQSNNYLSLILGALDSQVIDKINAQEEFEQNLFENPKLTISACGVVVQQQSLNYNHSAKSVADKNINEISAFLAKDLSAQKSNIALKNSVSYLIADDYSSKNYAPINLSVSEHLKEQSSANGTLYHAVLEKINFNNVNQLDDVKTFIQCNYTQSEIDSLCEYGYDNIYNNILLIKSLINKNDVVLKEQKFVMCLPYNQICNSNITDKVLVQGIIDLLIIKPDQIVLVDYKLSHKSKQQLLKSYSKQLELYALAVSKNFKSLPIKKCILSLLSGEIIDV